jgi:EAL domain-containing protein (putative c-di-GMP-specific phosphodiesterase class I)
VAIGRVGADDLRRALASNALTLHYQPQVTVAAGTLAGVEAFVRWPHLAHGMIGPGDMIPLIDHAKLHVDFDRWVVSAICSQMKQWNAANVDVPVVSVNIWSQTLRRPDALRLLDPIAAAGVDPRAIELECPRGATTDAALAKALTSIGALGVRLASEDAPDPRARLRFDTFKIAYPLSRDVVAHADHIRRVVAYAKKTGARVVADSVESVGQEDALVALGVGIVQGYLYGPEVAPDELRTTITRSSA